VRADLDAPSGEDLIAHAEEMSQVGYGRRRVVLRCGSTVYFANANLAPREGEVMPCLRHGYCGVEEVEAITSVSRLSTRRRAARRTVAEMVAYLQHMGICTDSQLRLERFTLRLVHRAAREGLVEVESDGEALLVRPRNSSDGRYVPLSETSSGHGPHRLGPSG
jgi:hypothetical protein